MPAIRNIGGAVTRLASIYTERKAGYNAGRYARDVKRDRENESRWNSRDRGRCSLELSKDMPDCEGISFLLRFRLPPLNIFSDFLNRRTFASPRFDKFWENTHISINIIEN